ncbi:hypothetical protein DSUL_150053 [Desulfovibrionales bacterium]
MSKYRQKWAFFAFFLCINGLYNIRKQREKYLNRDLIVMKRFPITTLAKEPVYIALPTFFSTPLSTDEVLI